MGKLFDETVKEYYGEIKSLTRLISLMPVMEAIDRLHDGVTKKKKGLKKSVTDIKYLAHEAEMLEMDQRVLELLTNKKQQNEH